MTKKLAFVALTTGLLLLFSALGTWQLQRRAWKLDLIERVENQLRQPAVTAPGPKVEIGPEQAYMPVKVRGHFLHEHETRVQALTVYGSGYWIMTPLQSDSGSLVLINRGFVDSAHAKAEQRRDGQLSGRVEISGLLRLSEPEGRWLQPNRPDTGWWYSRDVAEIGKTQQLPNDRLAPYFIDADATAVPGGWPIGGLTVVTFRNAHLGYALTWYSLALLAAYGLWIVLRPQQKEQAFAK